MGPANHTTDLILRDLQTPSGLVEVSQRPTDGYIQVTSLCQAAGKLYGNWHGIQVDEYLEATQRYIGIPIDVLIEKITTGRNEFRGTWAHPLVAVEIARWCCANFAVQVNQWYLDWCAGYLPPPKPKTLVEVLQESLPALAALTIEHDERLTEHDKRLILHGQQIIELKTNIGATYTKRVKRWQRIPREESYDDMRQLLYEFAASRCLWCGLIMTFTDGQPLTIEIDEVNPCGNGGWRDWLNIQPLCNRCNNRKHDHVGARWDFRDKHPHFIAQRDEYLAWKEKRQLAEWRQQSLFQDWYGGDWVNAV
jgi:5-methylcytosine-specific restriction endonuclease McrA